MLELNGTSLIFALSFLVFVYLLNKVLWQPIRKIKEERAFDLKAELDKAKSSEEKTNSIAQQVKAEIESLKKHERNSIDAIFAESKKAEEEEEAQLKKELEFLKQKAQRELESERDSLLKSLDKQSQEVALSIIEKVIPESPQLKPSQDMDLSTVR